MALDPFSILGAASSIFGGFGAADEERKRQAEMERRYREANAIMDEANKYDPYMSAEGYGMKSAASMNLGDYRAGMFDALKSSYGRRGMAGSSMAESALNPGVEDAFHRQRQSANLGLANAFRQMRSQKMNEASTRANFVMGQGDRYGNLAQQAGQDASSAFGNAFSGLSQAWARDQSPRYPDIMNYDRSISRWDDNLKQYVKIKPSGI